MNTHLRTLFLLLLLPALGGLAYLGWRAYSASLSHTQPRRVLFYQDSMHPWVKSDQPGKCTICDMDLTPIYEGERGFGVNDNMVVLRSNSVTVLNVQTEEVKRRPLVRTLRVAGTLEADESHKTIVSAPIACRIQALAVPYVGVEVRKGDTLATLFTPELVQRRSYLSALGVKYNGPADYLPAAGAKTDPYASDLVAPQDGTVIERSVYPGQYVEEGAKLLTLVDSSLLWFRFDVYEQQLPWLEPGQTLELTVVSVPGKTFPAMVAFIDPTINEAARTVKVRADIPNPVVGTNAPPHRLLRFGMYAEGRIRAQAPDAIAVPRAAVLFPGGTSASVYLDQGNGAYERRRVKLGRQGDDRWEILEGLDEGDRVVIAGNVLMDAQAQFDHGGEAEAPDASAAGDELDVLPGCPAPGPGMASGESMAAPGAPAAVVPRATPSPRNHGTNDMASIRLNAHCARFGIRDDLRQTRMSIISEARASGTNSPMDVPRQAMQAFLAEATRISQTLAADDLKAFNVQIEQLPAALAALRKDLIVTSPRAVLIRGLSDLDAEVPAKDLAEARARFLPFSTATVALVELLKKEDAAFAGLKIYHCPMAPKPGLWVQDKGPLANPFFGAAMETCGEEIIRQQ